MILNGDLQHGSRLGIKAGPRREEGEIGGFSLVSSRRLRYMKEIFEQTLENVVSTQNKVVSTVYSEFLDKHNKWKYKNNQVILQWSKILKVTTWKRCECDKRNHNSRYYQKALTYFPLVGRVCFWKFLYTYVYKINQEKKIYPWYK